MRLYALFMYALWRANILVLIYCCLRTKVDIKWLTPLSPSPESLHLLPFTPHIYPLGLDFLNFWPLDSRTPDLSNFRPFEPLTPWPFHPFNSLTPHSFISSPLHLFTPSHIHSLTLWPLDPLTFLIPLSLYPVIPSLLTPWPHDPLTPLPHDP